mgnify:CR=1 FL=1
MGRAKSSLSLVLREAYEYIEQLIARDWVEPARRLVEDKQIRRMGEREGERKLYLHARGELGNTLALIERKEPHIFSVK